MRLSYLRLENYRRFADAELEFPDGVLGLVGRNGAGKSTIIEAIGWALFGHEASRTGKDLLRLRGASGDCRVTLAFELGGEQYEVVRVLAGKGQGHLATVKVGGKLVVAPGPNSAKEATRAVERLLRLDRDAFFTAMVCRQGELNALSNLQPAKRKELVMRLLRIDAIDGAITFAREAKRLARAQLEALAGTRLDPAVLGARAQELRGQRLVEEETQRGALTELAKVEASLVAVGKAREAAEALRREHDGLTGQLAVLQAHAQAAQRGAEAARRELGALEALAAEQAQLAPQAARFLEARAEAEKLEGLRERARERQRLETEARDLERQLQGVAAQHAAAQAEAAQVSGLAPALEHGLQALRAAEGGAAEARAQLASLAKAQREAEAQITDAEARRAQLAALGPHTPCPTCERPLAEAHAALLGRLDAELASARAAIAARLRRRQRLEQALVEAEAAHRAARSTLEALHQRSEQLARREAEAALLERQRHDLQRRLGERRAALEPLASVVFDEAAYVARRKALSELARAHERALHLAAQLERRPGLEEARARHEADLARANAEGEAIDARRRGLGHDPAARQALEERFQALQARARAQAVEAERRAGAVQRIDGELARLAEEQARQQALEARMAALRDEVVLLDRLAGDRDAGLLADFRSHLMGRIRPALGERAGELFRTCTEARYEGLELTEDYDLLVLDGGEPFPLARFSGGEADLANLCLRIAVGELLTEHGGEHLGFLALDEVLGSQDEQRRAQVLHALARLRGRFRQVMLITHIEEVKDALEHVVYVEDAEGGTSRLTTLEDAAPLIVEA